MFRFCFRQIQIPIHFFHLFHLQFQIPFFKLSLLNYQEPNLFPKSRPPILEVSDFVPA